jgi:ethanolamine ammonia-lyase large subunit
MALLQATLSTELQALEPTDDPAVAIARLADAFGAYFEDAMVGSTQVASAALLEPAKASSK